MAAEHVRRLVSLLEDQAKTCLDQATATRVKLFSEDCVLKCNKMALDVIGIKQGLYQSGIYYVRRFAINLMP